VAQFQLRPPSWAGAALTWAETEPRLSRNRARLSSPEQRLSRWLRSWQDPVLVQLGPAFGLLDSAATAHFILSAFQPSLLSGAQPLPSRSSCSWLIVRQVGQGDFSALIPQPEAKWLIPFVPLSSVHSQGNRFSWGNVGTFVPLSSLHSLENWSNFGNPRTHVSMALAGLEHYRVGHVTRL
jgi:hypothetical protein